MKGDLLAGAAEDIASEDNDSTGMASNFSELQEELVRSFGEEGPLPKLAALQRMDRIDLEQVINSISPSGILTEPPASRMHML